LRVYERVGNANDSTAALACPHGKRTFDVGCVAARCRNYGNAQ
jgi:hypothetical protein